MSVQIKANVDVLSEVSSYDLPVGTVFIDNDDDVMVRLDNGFARLGTTTGYPRDPSAYAADDSGRTAVGDRVKRIIGLIEIM